MDWYSYFSFPPKSLMCTYVTYFFDPHRDYLLSCGHGQLIIKRHDSLCDIFYHALLTKNKNVQREQRCYGNVESRPGDVDTFELEDSPVYFVQDLWNQDHVLLIYI